jgi:hypothetical protein
MLGEDISDSDGWRSFLGGMTVPGDICGSFSCLAVGNSVSVAFFTKEQQKSWRCETSWQSWEARVAERGGEAFDSSPRG